MPHCLWNYLHVHVKVACNGAMQLVSIQVAKSNQNTQDSVCLHLWLLQNHVQDVRCVVADNSKAAYLRPLKVCWLLAFITQPPGLIHCCCNSKSSKSCWLNLTILTSYLFVVVAVSFQHYNILQAQITNSLKSQSNNFHLPFYSSKPFFWNLIPPWVLFVQPFRVTPNPAVDSPPMGWGRTFCTLVDYFRSLDIVPYHLFYLAVYDTLILVSAILDISLCNTYEEIHTFLLGLGLCLVSEAWTTIHVLMLGQPTSTMAAKWKGRRTLIDLYTERDQTRWYWRCAATLSAFIIMSGYVPACAHEKKSFNWTAIASSFSPPHSTTPVASPWIKTMQVYWLSSC